MAGTIIGAAIFVQPSEVTAEVPSIVGILMVWLIAGILTLMGSLVCAEFSRICSRGGGVYGYLTQSYGPWLGFLWGWAMFWTMHSGIVAAIAVVVARYSGFVISLNPTSEKLLAIGAIWGLTGVNLLGVSYGTRLQTVITSFKLAAILLIVGVGLYFAMGRDELFPGGMTAGLVEPSSFLRAVAAGLFAFGGWHMVTYTEHETVDPARTIPRALVLGVGIVTLAYLAMNSLYLAFLPIDRVAQSSRIAADLAAELLGNQSGVIISTLVVVSAFGALAGIVLAGPRVYQAMSRDGRLFRWAGAIHPRFHTPHRALLLQAAWASVLVATGSFRTLVSLVIYTEWIFFGLLAVGLLKPQFRRRLADLKAPAWLPAAAVCFALSAFGVAVNQIASDPRNSAVGMGLVLAGLPVYFLQRYRQPIPTEPRNDNN